MLSLSQSVKSFSEHGIFRPLLSCSLGQPTQRWVLVRCLTELASGAISLQMQLDKIKGWKKWTQSNWWRCSAILSEELLPQTVLDFCESFLSYTVSSCWEFIFFFLYFYFLIFSSFFFYFILFSFLTKGRGRNWKQYCFPFPSLCQQRKVKRSFFMKSEKNVDIFKTFETSISTLWPILGKKNVSYFWNTSSTISWIKYFAYCIP